MSAQDDCAAARSVGPLPGERYFPKTEYPRDSCIHQLFEEQAKSRPDAIALKFRDQKMTYRELNERANRVARRLRSSGAAPDTLIGVMLERSFEMVIGLLGVLKSGAAFVPFDPNYPAERLRFMARDSRVPVILSQSTLKPRFLDSSWCEAKLLFVDDDFPGVQSESADDLPCHTTAENLAYVMYTSGSTGTPKGVMVPHRGVVRLVRNSSFMILNEHETFLQFSPISFDASTLEIWGPLLNGGCLAIMAPETASLQDLGKAVKDYGVTSMWLTAGLFNLMVDQRLEDLRPLRQLLVGGDVVSPVHVRRAMQVLSSCTFINGYGPTEGTTFTCCHTISRDDAEGPSIPIGRPIANTEVLILNSDNDLAAIGEAGELCAGGDGLARGYLNAAELTAQKFHAHPFSDDIGARIYRTGDLARYRADGTIEFLGRIDAQVKINGYRIEPGEIEAILTAREDVRQAVVVVQADGPSDKKLVAYVVPERGGCPTSELRSFLKDKLPAYMQPASFVLLNELPLSPNGKVDRTALASKPLKLSQHNSATDSRDTPLQEQIATVWQKILGVQSVGSHDNFFDVGGDSLQLLEAHAELQKVCGREIAVTDLFEHTTVNSLAQHLNGEGDRNRSNISDAQDRARKQQSVWERQREARRIPRP